MAISDMIWEVQTSLKKIKRKNKFKKARKAFNEDVELQTTLMTCRGKLEICKKDLNRAINDQSRNIVEGLKQGTDTTIQQQILWDAAVGYLMVRDAIYALETISSYDAVSHAYEMLDAAMKQVAGKKAEFPNSMKIGSTKERNAYGYITSSAAQKEKEYILEGFFEQLKLQGDIEARLEEARLPGDRQAEQRYAYTTGSSAESSDVEAYMRRLRGEPEPVKEEEYNLSNMLNTRPPSDSE